ncbi:hypothetical protein J7L48_02285 [bacterium]|nr:hypothetical protein [bacterium]
MKKSLLVSFIILIFVSIFSNHTIAIMDFKAKGVDNNSTSIVSDLFRDILFGKKIFTVVDRASMKQILKEQNLQQSLACSSEECAVQIGKILGVNSIVIGTLGKLGNAFILSIRLVNIENAKISWAKTAKIYDFNRIDEGVSLLVDDLVNSYRSGELNFTPQSTQTSQQIQKPIQQDHQNVLITNSNSNKSPNIAVNQGRNGQNVVISQGYQQEQTSSAGMDPGNSLLDSTLSAQLHTSKFLWFGAGCLFGIIGVGAAALVQPTPPSTALIGKNSSYITVYTENYKKVGKRVQTKQAIWGCLASSLSSSLFSLFYYFILIDL